SSYQVKSLDIVQVKRLTTNDLTDPSVGAVDGNLIAVNSASLSVTTLATPVAQSLVAGTSDFEFATIVLNAQSSGETVKVSKIVVTENASTTATNVGNYRLYKDSETSALTTTASTDSLSSGAVTFNLSNAIEISQSTPVTLHLKANLLSTATTTATHRLNVASSTTALTAIGKTTGNTLTNGSDITFAGSGQTMSVVSAGTLTLSLVSGSGASPSTNQIVNIGTAGSVYFAFKMTSQYENQKITSLKITATSTGANNLATTTLSNIKLYEGSATTPFAQASQFDTCGANQCTVTFTAGDNMLSAPVPSTGVTIYGKADVSAGGVAILGNNFKFMIASSIADVAIKGSSSGLTTGTKTGTPTASGVSYVASQNVKIEAGSLTTSIGSGAGVIVGAFKITNNGTAAVRLATSTFTFTNSGSATTTTNFRIYASAQGGALSDISGWNSGNGYLAAAGTTGISSIISFATSTMTDAEQTINGGSWRYLTIKTTAASALSDTYAFSISALGNVLYDVLETDLGYSGNSDGDLSDTIYGLYIDGLPALSTVTRTQ
ncbi:hypothetical protein HZB04_01610, partial [Candidatus Wolfebacteria bacterium]|nr:hypothetical protein [Candidatus Wolfebacteria bacterium]